jgi:hypothetical protein
VVLDELRRSLRPLPALHAHRRRRRRVTPLRIAAAVAVLGGVGIAAAAVASHPLARPKATADAAVSAPEETSTTTTTLDYSAGVFTNDLGRWAVGIDGDVATLGDWDCDGTRTLALLRPSTGKVVAFNRWATDGDVAADQLGTIPEATALEAADVNGDGCDDVLVKRGDGQTTVLRPGDHL